MHLSSGGDVGRMYSFSSHVTDTKIELHYSFHSIHFRLYFNIVVAVAVVVIIIIFFNSFGVCLII